MSKKTKKDARKKTRTLSRTIEQEAPKTRRQKRSKNTGDKQTFLRRIFALASLRTDQAQSSVSLLTADSSEQSQQVSLNELVLKRVSTLKDYSKTRSDRAPFGSFAGRPIIVNGSRVNGGVYVSSKAKEALVLDDSRGSLASIYSQLMVEHVRKNGTRKRNNSEERLITSAMQLAQKLLPLVSEEAIAVLTIQESLRADEKVSIDLFLDHQLGTVRHQVLLAAYLLEKLQEGGHITGKLYLEARLHKGIILETLVFASEKNDTYLFDPSQELLRSFSKREGLVPSLPVFNP